MGRHDGATDDPSVIRTHELRQAESSASHFSPLLHAPADPPQPTSSPSRLVAMSPAATLAFSNKNRPRAGTLPSTFHLAPSSSSSASIPPRNPLALDHLLAPPPLHNGAASLPGSGATTPLDLSYPSSSSSSNPSASRLRSGSLTALAPTSGSLSSAFGPGTNVFSSGDWTPRPVQQAAAAANPRPDDVRSPDGSAYGDEHVRTLDYLGLDDEVPGSAAVGSGAGSFGSVGEGSVTAPQPTTTTTRDESLDVLAPTMHRLGSTGSMRLPQNPLAGVAAQETRLRSNTIAAFPRTSPSAAADSLLRPFHHHQASNSLSYPNLVPTAASPAASGDREDAHSSYHRSSSSTDSSRLLYSTTEVVDLSEDDPERSSPRTTGGAVVASGSPLVSLIPPLPSSSGDSLSSLAGHRARAATIGILDDSREPVPRRRAGTTVGLGPGTSPLGLASIPASSSSSSLAPSASTAPHLDHTAPSSLSTPAAVASTAVSSTTPAGATNHLGRAFGRLSVGAADDPKHHFALPASPYAFPNPHGQSSSRPRTPEHSVSMSPPHQQPTRSLWVGNLDPNTTPNDLQHVFAPYGPIESLRLIPDKVSFSPPPSSLVPLVVPFFSSPSALFFLLFES